MRAARVLRTSQRWIYLFEVDLARLFFVRETKEEKCEVPNPNYWLSDIFHYRPNPNAFVRVLIS